MARPRSSVTDEVLATMRRLGRATWKRVHQQLKDAGVDVGPKVVRWVMDNLARAGHLERRKEVERAPGVYRPMRVYGWPTPRDTGPQLADVMAAWR